MHPWWFNSNFQRKSQMLEKFRKKLKQNGDVKSDKKDAEVRKRPFQSKGGARRFASFLLFNIARRPLKATLRRCFTRSCEVQITCTRISTLKQCLCFILMKLSLISATVRSLVCNLLQFSLGRWYLRAAVLIGSRCCNSKTLTNWVPMRKQVSK